MRSKGYTSFFLTAIALVHLTSCMNESKIEVQGHRGYKGLHPENTLPAFEKAIEIGVHTLEMDVVVSKDNKVVVSHEPYMNPVICLDPDGNPIEGEDPFPYNIYELTFEEIQAFDCGSLKHPDCPDQINQVLVKPLLKDVIEMAEGMSSKIKYNIELKSEVKAYGIFVPPPEEFVSLVHSVLEPFDLGERVNLQSFDLNILDETNNNYPKTIQALLVDEDEIIEEKLAKLSFRPKIISPDKSLLDEATVKDLHSRGYKVIPWTVNKDEDMERMISIGVDAIITDYPERLMTKLSE